MKACEQRVRIPIAAKADSLNIAVAGAIAMHRYLAPRDNRPESASNP